MIELTTATDGAVHTIGLTGELDHRTTPRLRDALTGLDLGAGDLVVLDLAELAFCDSSGLSTLLFARELVLGADAALDLVAPPRTLVKMLNLTGMVELFTIR
ncbi:STAS domain-containing protein [Saccharothrix sp. HUAS TT1]|uniref:STAS domain-containing protein n=1 Tax=unclassified Saccharothrix TaxID=2593673 RepID=UPI00345C4EBE